MGRKPKKQGVNGEAGGSVAAGSGAGAGGRQQFVVTAYLSNGRREDITDRVRYISEDGGVAEASDGGIVQGKKTGETNILIRTPGRIRISAGVGVIAKPIPNYPKVEARNYIDQYVFGKLRRFQILPSELSSDAGIPAAGLSGPDRHLAAPATGARISGGQGPAETRQADRGAAEFPEYVDYWGFQFSDLMRATPLTAETLKGRKPTKTGWSTASPRTSLTTRWHGSELPPRATALRHETSTTSGS